MDWNAQTVSPEGLRTAVLHSSFSFLSENFQSFKYEIPELWDPRLEPRSVARERLIRDFMRWLEGPLDEVESALADAGYLKPKRKVNADHLDDLVDYLLNGKSFAKVAADRADAVQQDTVEKRIRRVAARMSLDLRKSS